MPYRTRLVYVTATVAALFPLLSGAQALAEAPEEGTPGESAVWAPQQLRFVFLGFTSHYSCDGLATKMRSILLQLGARPDLRVQELPCSGQLGTPTVFPGVTVNMSVLKPASAVSDSAAATPLAAHWATVQLSTDRDPLREAGDCELIEQVKALVLPKFTTRNVDFRSNCIPHQLTVGGTVLRADVLIADPQVAQGQSAPTAGAPVTPRATSTPK